MTEAERAAAYRLLTTYLTDADPPLQRLIEAVRSRLA